MGDCHADEFETLRIGVAIFYIFCQLILCTKPTVNVSTNKYCVCVCVSVSLCVCECVCRYCTITGCCS